jgi:hypothetical protein
LIGGIYQSSPDSTHNVTLKNTIIANGSTGSNCYQELVTVGTIVSLGYNLSSDSSCALYFNQHGDLANANPHLGPLANNGGPTLTHLREAPSLVIDAIPLGLNGCGTTLTTDQRGMPRPYNGKCDLGAVEATWPYSRLWLALVRR